MSYCLTNLLAFHNPSSPKAKCPGPWHHEEGGTNQEDRVTHSSKKEHLVHLLKPTAISHLLRSQIPVRSRRQKPICRMTFQTSFLWRKEREGGRKGCAVNHRFQGCDHEPLSFKCLPCLAVYSLSSISLANPKSAILHISPFPTRMFADRRSLWM